MIIKSKENNQISKGESYIFFSSFKHFHKCILTQNIYIIILAVSIQLEIFQNIKLFINPIVLQCGIQMWPTYLYNFSILFIFNESTDIYTKLQCIPNYRSTFKNALASETYNNLY